jgi:hypothetical protein
MTKYYFDACFSSASSLSAVQDRMTVLMNLLNAPAEFYAEDIGLSGGMIQMLRAAHLIKEVPGKSKEVFICVDEERELYKRVPVKCWRLTLDRKTYREGLTEYFEEVVNLFTSALIMTTPSPF